MRAFEVAMKPARMTLRGSQATRSFSVRVRHSSAWRTLSYFEAPGRKVHLLGTAHVSKRSADEVRRLANSLQPEIIFVELCEKRACRLRGESVADDQESFSTLWWSIIAGKLSLSDAVFKMVVQMLQARSAGTIGLQPGVELLAAMEMADELGAHLVLGDCDVEETTKRIGVAVWDELGAVMSLRPGPGFSRWWWFRPTGGTIESS